MISGDGNLHLTIRIFPPISEGVEKARRPLKFSQENIKVIIRMFFNILHPFDLSLPSRYNLLSDETIASW